MPVVVERVQTLNCYRLNWTRTRRAALVKLIKSVNASVILVQECTEEMRADICTDTGLAVGYAKGNVGFLIKPEAWSVEHDGDVVLTAGDDDRRAVCVVLRHQEAGTECKMLNTHLTNLEGGGQAGEGHRIGQITQALGAFYGVHLAGGDLNSRGAVQAVLTAAGFLLMKDRTGIKSGIDELATKPSMKVVRGGKVAHGSATDHDTYWLEWEVNA